MVLKQKSKLGILMAAMLAIFLLQSPVYSETLESFDGSDHTQENDLFKDLGSKKKISALDYVLAKSKQAQKNGKYAEAMKPINYFIKKKFLKEHHNAVLKFKKDGASQLGDMNVDLLKLYLQKASVYLDILENDLGKQSEKERNTMILMIHLASGAAIEKGMEEDFADELEDRLGKILKEQEAIKVKGSWFLGTSYITWRDEVTLITGSGAEVAIRSTNSGALVCMGRKWTNAYHEWEGLVGFAQATATVGNDNPSVQYFQSGVPVQLLVLAGSYHHRPYSGGVGIGFEGGFVARRGDYEVPASATGIDSDTIVTLSTLVSLRWRYGESSKYELQAKMGKMWAMPSSTILVGFAYNF